MATDTSKGGRNRPNARARAAALREQQRKREARKKLLTVGGIVGLVLVVVAVMVIIFINKPDKKNAAERTPASAAIIQQLTTVPAATFTAVGAGTTSGGGITKITGSPLAAAGKPVFFYYGAEYCPFCATERWPVVVALSRFGKWSSLSQTTSASQDTPASIPTLSFYGSKFSSPYLTFQSVETTTNQRSGSSYKTLQTPTQAQQALVEKYDGPNGSIPFLDFGNKYMSSGATYAYQVLQGKAPDEIAAAIRDSSTATSKGVLGAANAITAAVCEMTGGKPGSVCNSPEITKLRAALTAQK